MVLLSFARGPFALKDMNFDPRLIVPQRSRRSPTCAVGIVVLRSISLVFTPPKVSMPSEKRGNVEQQNVFNFSFKNARLDRSAYRNDFIRIDALVWLFS